MQPPLRAQIQQEVSRALSRDALREEFEHSTEELRLITDNLPVLIAYFDSSEIYRFSNRIHHQWWGLTEEQILGRNLREILGEENYRQAEPHVSAVLKGGHVAFEQWTEYPGVGKRYVRVEYIPHFTDDSTACGAFVLASDLTDTKKAQEELQKQERQQQIIFDTVPAMIWYKDSKNRILKLNRQAAKATGGNVEQLSGVSTYDLYPEEASKYHQDDLDVIQTGQPKLGIIEPFTIQSGEKRWVRTDKFPYRNDLGEITGVVVFSVDITEQKRAEDALRESEGKMRRLLESTKVIPWESDVGANQFTYIGPQAIKIFGYSLNEWYRENFWRNHLHPEDRDATITAATERCEKMNEYELEYRMITADGHVIWLRDIVNVVRNELEEPIILQGFLFDITAHKQADAEKRKLEEQLRQAQKMEALGTLAGGIAHDFNNILGGIIGYTELSLCELPAQSSVRNYLEQVSTFSLRAKQLVQQILTFSKRKQAERSPCRVKTLVDEVVSLAHATLPSSIKITTHFGGHDLYTNANATQLHQIILNIVTNAGYSMRERGGNLTITVSGRIPNSQMLIEHPELKSVPYVVISVRDTGNGMSSETAKRIFEPYFTTKPFGEGSGLGLSVAHGIVANHGGSITVSSTLGVGSLFEVYLPESSAIADGITVSENIQACTTRKHILFVDDEELLASLGQQVLSRIGYQVTICTSAKTALHLIEKNHSLYDLLITDLTMPDINGDALAREVYKIRANLPVILCSGMIGRVAYSENECAIRCSLAKPYKLSQLTEAVSKALERSQH